MPSYRRRRRAAARHRPGAAPLIDLDRLRPRRVALPPAHGDPRRTGALRRLLAGGRSAPEDGIGAERAAVRVIVQGRPGAAPPGRVTGRHALLDAVTATVTLDELAALSRHPGVRRLSLDADVRASGLSSSSYELTDGEVLHATRPPREGGRRGRRHAS